MKNSKINLSIDTQLATTIKDMHFSHMSGMLSVMPHMITEIERMAKSGDKVSQEFLKAQK